MTALICLGQLVSSAIVGALIESYGSSRTGTPGTETTPVRGPHWSIGPFEDTCWRIINPYISIIAAVGFLHCWFIVDYPEGQSERKLEGESSESEELTNRKEETFSSIAWDWTKWFLLISIWLNKLTKWSQESLSRSLLMNIIEIVQRFSDVCDHKRFGRIIRYHWKLLHKIFQSLFSLIQELQRKQNCLKFNSEIKVMNMTQIPSHCLMEQVIKS